MSKKGKFLLRVFGFLLIVVGVILLIEIIDHMIINVNWIKDSRPDSTFFNYTNFGIILEYIFFIMLGVCIVGLGFFLIMIAYAYTDYMRHNRTKNISIITLGGTGLLMIIAGAGLLIRDIIGHIEAVAMSHSYIWGSELLGEIWYWCLFFAIPILLVVLGVVFVYAGIVLNKSHTID